MSVRKRTGTNATGGTKEPGYEFDPIFDPTEQNAP
jgi:hypothetical protein